MAAYRLRALARQDLEEIWDYTFERWGVEQAERYFAGLFACFDDLAANPGMGRPRDELLTGVRSFPQGRHVVFYEIGPGSIDIIAIVHQSADVERHLISE